MTTNPLDTSGSNFSSAELDRIQSETPVQQVEFREELDSSNDLALQLAGKADQAYPLLVLTEKQTAGRGRRTNRWWSSAGALTFSLVLETNSAELPQSSWPQASLTVGLAVCEALEEILPDTDFLLKWPNDVYVKRRKICGVLVEAPSGQSNKLVLGIGINVNNSLSSAPEEIASMATALCDLSGRSIPLVEVLIHVLNKLCARLDWIGSNDEELRTRWRNRCLLTHHQVQIDSEAGRIVGICQGIDDQGALVLQTPTGLESCLAGTVTLLD